MFTLICTWHKILVEHYYNIIYRVFKLTSLSIDRAECRMFTYNNTYMTWYIPRLYLPCLIIYTTAVVLYINIILYTYLYTIPMSSCIQCRIKMCCP